MESKDMDSKDLKFEGRSKYFMDIDRMTDEGLAGGYITDDDNGEIDEAVEIEPESPPRNEGK